MLKGKRIGFIGGGNMAEALIGGLIGSGAAQANQIICSDIQAKRLDFLKKTFGIDISVDNLGLVREAEIIIYVVKPQNMVEVLHETSELLDKSKLIVSCVAGVPLRVIETLLGKDLRLVRVMPNVAALIKEGATAISAGKHALTEDIQIAMNVFSSVGKCVHVKDDQLMDAVTGLSGSGPAYVFVILEALADAGVKMGLSRQEAVFLASQTVLGAVKLLIETGNHPGILKDMVTSPAGTTIAGLHELERGGLRAILMDTVEAATLRSRELGNQMIEKFRNNH